LQTAYCQREGDKLRCLLCPHRCLLAAGKRGICRVRECTGDEIISLNYASCTSVALDPIEKKPLYHFYPGGTILSVGTWGCNLACPFCQNWSISQGEVPSRIISPEKLADLARGSIGVAYTYSEPTVWYEYVKDAAQAVKERGLVNVLVTNGMISQEPLAELLPLIDACNIDIKAMDHDFYRRTVKGDLQTVLEAAKAAKGQCHLEITNLIIPGLNDAEGQIRALIDWVAENLGRDTPLHFSRYFPAYQWDAPPTSPDTMIKALEFGRARLDYVYLGNFPYPSGSDTYCPECRRKVLSRSWGKVRSWLKGKECPQCGREVLLVGEVQG
jgi:pyruvate formate lyase activating enzyme